MNYWILKTEPGTYSFDDLLRDKKTSWDGVRNYQARNNLQSMKVGDHCLIYHSVGPKEIVGIARVSKTAYPDPKAEGGPWVAVDIEPIKRLAKPVTLEQLKTLPGLQKISLIRQSRLSVCPVSAQEWDLILAHHAP